MLTRFLLCVLAGRKKMPFITLNVNQHYSATVNIERQKTASYCAKVNQTGKTVSLQAHSHAGTAVAPQNDGDRRRKSRRVGAGTK